MSPVSAPHVSEPWPTLAQRCAELVSEDVVQSSQSARAWAPVLAQLPQPLVDCIAHPIVRRTRASGCVSAEAALRFGLCVPGYRAQMWAAIDPLWGLLSTPLFCLLEQPDATIALVARFVREVHFGGVWQLPIVQMQDRLQALRHAVLHGGFAPSPPVDTTGFVAVLDDVLAQLHTASRLRYSPHGARLLPEHADDAASRNQMRLAIAVTLNTCVLDAWLEAAPDAHKAAGQTTVRRHAAHSALPECSPTTRADAALLALRDGRAN